MEWKWFWCHINLFVFGTNQNVCGMDYWWEKCKKMKLLLAFDAHLICVQLKLFPALEVPHLSLLISLQNKWWWKIDIILHIYFCWSAAAGEAPRLSSWSSFKLRNNPSVCPSPAQPSSSPAATPDPVLTHIHNFSNCQNWVAAPKFYYLDLDTYLWSM